MENEIPEAVPVQIRRWLSRIVDLGLDFQNDDLDGSEVEVKDWINNHDESHLVSIL